MAVSGLIYTFDEAPGFADWRHFLLARWRWLRRRVPFLRRETTLAERQAQAARAQRRAYQAQWKAAKEHLEAGTADRSDHPHIAYLNSLANSQQAYMGSPLQQAYMQQSQMSPYYHGLLNQHPHRNSWSWLIR